MAVDKKYCMSSYLAFRYIEDDNKDFYEDMHHKNIAPIPLEDRIPVDSSKDIDIEITKQFAQIRDKKLGVLLSGGMDSAICASYMSGCDAYTFRFLGGQFQREELQRAEYYAKYYGLKLHYVDIDWNTVENNIDELMLSKAAPVHSIEPQILQAARQAKNDGIEVMVIGESSDLIFGGMNKLLGQDWTFNDFKHRYMFTDPDDVLVEPEDMTYLFERYRKDEGKIDFLRFMDEIFSVESSSSYLNAFSVSGVPYFDPYAKFVLKKELDLQRIRNGEPKYLIRELMKQKYPEIDVPAKIPMPRPVDFYFENWTGPKRPEFKLNLNMNDFNENQKWQLWCLERFLDNNEKDS